MLFLFYLLPFVPIQDSVKIEGKIENLTIQHYRQADVLRLYRVNVLRSNEAIVERIKIEPDGSFKCAIPIIYPKETFKLSYGPWVNTTLIAEKGTLGLTIEARDFGLKNNPIQFQGLNAEANNRHLEVETTIDQVAKQNKELNDVFKKLSVKTATSAWGYLQSLRDKKKAIFQNLQANKPTNKLLNEWVNADFENETKAIYYEHLYYLAESIPVLLADSVALDTSALLTFEKANSYFWYARQSLKTAKSTINSLSVSKLSEMLLQYIPDLTELEKTKLTQFAKTNTARNKDLEMLNNLYTRNESDLNNISNYELYKRQIGETVNDKNLDFLQTQFLIQWAKMLTIKNLSKLYQHIRPQVKNSLFRASFDEVYQSESRDSLAIKLVQNQSFNYYSKGRFDNNLIEAAAGCYLYKNGFQTAQQIFEAVKQTYKGQKILLVYWQPNDLEKLKDLTTLRTYLSDKDIVFVTICDDMIDEPLWKEIIVKNKWRGVHIQSTSAEQTNYWTDQFLEQNTPVFAIFDDKGKRQKADAPNPSNYEEWQEIVEKWRK